MKNSVQFGSLGSLRVTCLATVHTLDCNHAHEQSSSAAFAGFSVHPTMSKAQLLTKICTNMDVTARILQVGASTIQM